MTQTLTQLISQVQTMFIDDGTRFTTPTCTAAVRQALKDFNAAAPVHAAETRAVVAGQYEYEIEDPACLEVVDVLLEGTDALAEDHVPQVFLPHVEDSRWFIRLRDAARIGHVDLPLHHSLHGQRAGQFARQHLAGPVRRGPAG